MQWQRPLSTRHCCATPLPQPPRSRARPPPPQPHRRVRDGHHPGCDGHWHYCRHHSGLHVNRSAFSTTRPPTTPPITPASSTSWPVKAFIPTIALSRVRGARGTPTPRRASLKESAATRPPISYSRRRRATVLRMRKPRRSSASCWPGVRRRTRPTSRGAGLSTTRPSPWP